MRYWNGNILDGATSQCIVMVDGNAGTRWKGLMNRIGLISYHTAGEATIKAEIIRKVGYGKS